MKKNGTIIWVSMLIAVFVSNTAFNSFQTNKITKAGPDDEFVIPEDVNQIIDKSCFGCHNLEDQYTNLIGFIDLAEQACTNQTQAS